MVVVTGVVVVVTTGVVVVVTGVVVVVVTGVVVVVTGVVVVVVTGVVVVVVTGVVVVVVVAVEQVGTATWLSSSVTAPVWAKTRPLTVAPVSKVAVVSARIVPANDVDVPSVAEDPTCQKTLQACAPLISTTELLVAVVRVEPA